MALLGPNPTPSSVAGLVRQNEGQELFEIFDEVSQFTNGPISTHLAANALTRTKLVEFLTEDKLREVWTLSQDVSDPDFTALSFSADERADLRPTILNAAKEQPRNPASLNIYTRLMSKSKLDLKLFDKKDIDQFIEWAQIDSEEEPEVLAEKLAADVNFDAEADQKRRHQWSMSATSLLKALTPMHKDYLLQYASTHMGSDTGYAAVRATVDEIPAMADPVWQTTPIEPLSADYLHMSSTLANTATNRDKIKQEEHIFSMVRAAATKGDVIAGIVEAKVLAGLTSQTGDIKAAAQRLDVLSEKLFEKKVDQYSLEGLACTAMSNSVRRRISMQQVATAGQAPGATKTTNDTVVFQLVSSMREHVGATAYAVLAVLTQSVKFPIKPTKDEEEQDKLRIQASGKSVFDLEEEEEIDTENDKFHARQVSGRICDQILVASAIGWLAANATRLTHAAHVQMATFLRELASHQELKRRQKEATQGSAVLAMFLWANDKPAKLDNAAKSIAASVLSKILATVPPQIALTEKVSSLVVITPIIEQVNNEASKRPNLDTFEALRALTNSSSGNSDELRTAIARKVWPRLPAALNSEFLQVRRSALELVCNLMLVPSSAQHFLQRTPESNELLSLLGRSIIVDDEDSRLAAAGGLAISAEWETAPEIIGQNSDCISSISRSSGLFMEDDPSSMRVLAALKTILKVTTAEMNDEVVERIVFFEGLTHLEELVDTIDPAGRSEVAKRVSQCIKSIAEYKVKNPS